MKITRDIQANPAAGERGFLDIYLPEDDAPHAFILGIHGGGWQNGDRKSYEHFWPRVKAAGLGFVLCSYRLATEKIFPTAYLDLLEVLKWLDKNATEYGLDRECCAILGGSAGGHLVSLLASRATAEAKDIIPIKAAVSYCGIMDMPLQYQHDVHTRGSAMTVKFMGGSPEDRAELFAQASPLEYVHSQMPSMWLAHGDSDNCVPVENSRKFAAALQEAGVEYSFTEAPGRDHTMTAVDGVPTEEIEFLFEDDMFTFVKKHLDK